MNRMILTVGALIVLGLGAGYWWMMQGSSGGVSGVDEVKVPEITETARAGEIAFDANCASCHGPNAAGTGQGPPLVHRIYEPSHHGDQAFLLAAQRGVQAHHWRFGDMPPVAGVTRKDVESIVVYVRELQRANGIR